MDEENKKLSEEEIYSSVGIVGPNVKIENEVITKDIEDDNEEEDEDIYEGEEYIRLMTKDGVEYLINAPLPPSKGFIINDDGHPIIWNPMSLRMEKYVPEEVRIKKISLFQLKGSGDVFRIFCLATKGSEYKKEGLSVIRTIPFNEISSWDTIIDESALGISINQEEEEDS